VAPTRYGGAVTGPQDPFADDPDDPAAQLDDDLDDLSELTPEDREDVIADLADIEVFQTLLGPRGVRGLSVDCADCAVPHFFGWDLLRANLRSLLDHGDGSVHEPAHDPDPHAYVSWDYARGYVDGIEDMGELADSEDD